MLRNWELGFQQIFLKGKQFSSYILEILCETSDVNWKKKTPRLDTELQVPNVVFIYGLYNVLFVSNNSGTKGSRVISLSTAIIWLSYILH